MRAFLRTLKVAKLWLFMCALALLHWLRKNTHLRTVDAWEALFADILNYIKLAVLFTVPAILLFLLIRILAGGLAALREQFALRSMRASDGPSYLPSADAASLPEVASPLRPANFRDEPERFDRKVIRMQGRVERVSRLRKRDLIRRYIARWFAALFGSSAQPVAPSHQRFFLSSPQLRKGEWMLVLHNAQGKPLALKRGMWIEVQGEYLHITIQKGGLFSRRSNSYGRIHFTHPPKGSIAPIKADPKGVAQRKIEVVSEAELRPKREAAERIERGLKGLPPLGALDL